MASKQLPFQKHRGFVRNLELIQEELSERQLADKSKQEEDEEKRKKEKAKMSKLNHNKNGNHGDGKLEEQGLIDPNENKIGEYHLYLDISWMRNTKIVKVPYTVYIIHPHISCMIIISVQHVKLSLCSALFSSCSSPCPSYLQKNHYLLLLVVSLSSP